MSHEIFFQKMKEALERDLGEQSKRYLTHYEDAKLYLCGNIYGEIKGRDPNLSDHSEKHINNVLRNVHQLLINDYGIIDGINLYCLGIIVLFHDVGNIEGRDDHQKKIASVYNRVRNRQAEFNQERNCVLKAAGAHTGYSSKDGSTDTLQDVPKVEHIDGLKIFLRDLAAILRLADECAEGYQRTSDYLDMTNQFSEISKPYHQYAKITNILIDKGDQRIVLTYNIDITSKDYDSSNLKSLLEFIYKRIIKLDIERRYCKHYTSFLYEFKKTEATINFYIDGEPVDFILHTIVLEDRFPKPKKEKDIDVNEIEILSPSLKISNVIFELAKHLNQDHEGFPFLVHFKSRIFSL